MKKFASILVLLSIFVIASAQIAGRYYNCYKLDNESITTTFLQQKNGSNTDPPTLTAFENNGNKPCTKIFFEIGFSPRFLNQAKNSTKPVMGKHTDNLLPTDRIDSISLNFYYKSKPVGYKMYYNKSQKAYVVENKYTNHAFLLRNLAAFKKGYNERDTLFTASSLVWHDILVVLQDSLPPDQRDLKAVFFIKFNDGQLIQKTM